MTVSVIIPVYNVKPYLERCVQSVQNQTYKDLEIEIGRASCRERV